MSRWGRFTARGGAEVERTVSEIVSEAAEALHATIEDHEYRAVLLIGGYGRGEGGVLLVDGRERPHNNLDFLIIARGSSDGAKVKVKADTALASLATRHGIGMDVGYVSEAQLRRSPCLVMWYDARFGHKLIAGNDSVLTSQGRFNAENILSADVRNLLVNRGTLLLINELLLASGRELDDNERRVIVKHAVKAIIGYGDALLFFHNGYDYSYEEKQRRMRGLTVAGAAFQSLYDEAMEFRFKPQYENYMSRDLGAWNASLRHNLASVHLACEALRLSVPGLTWEQYPRVAFQHSLRDGNTRPRAVAKKLISLIKEAGNARLRWHGFLGPSGQLGYASSRGGERLSLLFPAVAYDLGGTAFGDLAAQGLGASGDSLLELARAYLRAWTLNGDLNFQVVASKLGLKLEDSQ